MRCFFASDLHGRTDRYRKLFAAVEAERPDAVFLGGDLLPSPIRRVGLADWCGADFVNGFLGAEMLGLRSRLKEAAPRVFLIMGNDDIRVEEAAFLDGAARGLWEYVHMGRREFGPYLVYGYTYVPPSPFLLKDWERYDVSRYVDPGCVSPEEGIRTFPVSEDEKRYATIQEDLKSLAGFDNLCRAIFLFHAPPYDTVLDRAALDGRMVDHAPVDVHVGSIAIRRFIEKRQPLVTLHGHIHESARLTGSWRDRLGFTPILGGAHDGSELALVRFDPVDPDNATRELI